MDRYAIGIDLGGTKVLAGLVDGQGRVLARYEVATAGGSTDALVAQLLEVGHRVAADRAVVGIGVGVPATIDQRAGALIQAVNLPLRDVPLRSRLAEEFGVRAEIDNDGNCAALGEHRFGAAAGTAWSVALTLGTGVGGGVIADGRLLRGSRGAAAELGHLVIERDGRPCQGSCPGRGHVEAYCSGTALGERAREHGMRDAHDVIDRASAGDPTAGALVDDLARALGAALVGLANTFDPDAFVIGGGLGDAIAPLVLPTARAILAGEALEPNRDARVVKAALGPDAGMIGAAALVLD